MVSSHRLVRVLKVFMLSALVLPQIAAAGKVSKASVSQAGVAAEAVSVSACSASCPSDLNLDGVVDEKDQYLLKGVWGKVPAADSKLYSVAVCAAAISGDKNVTDGADLGILLGEYGKCAVAGAVSAGAASKAQ